MAFQDKYTKIKILQEKANKYNEEFDKLEEEGLDLDQIPQKIMSKLEEGRWETMKSKQMPFDKTDAIISVGNNLALGFEDTHKIKSTAQVFNQEIENRVRHRQDLLSNSSLGGEQVKAYEQELAKTQKEQIQQDKTMKEQAYCDHIKELMVSNDIRMPKHSNYGGDFQFTKEMQEICDFQNFEFHQRKNDLKWYTEAYAKNKHTMRK